MHSGHYILGCLNVWLRHFATQNADANFATPDDHDTIICCLFPIFIRVIQVSFQRAIAAIGILKQLKLASIALVNGRMSRF